MKINYKLTAMLIIALMIAGVSTATAANLTLTLNNTMDGTSSPLVNNATNITSADLLNTAGNVVESATTISPDGMTAQFDLSSISTGDYFIEVNGLAGALVPTRIDSTASDIIQSVGRRLRNSVIGDISNPAYRIKSYPSEISSSHPVVNYTTGINESKYAFVIVSGSASKIEVRVLNTSEELSNFSTGLTNHDGLSVSFQNWILGDFEDTNGVVIGNHGRLYNASTDSTTMVCGGCHANLNTKPATFSAIATGNGFCFRCHNGAAGPRNGFVDPIVQVQVANGTIAGTVTNVSGSAIEGATVAADTQSNNTDVNGNYSISIAAGTYIVAASATGYQNNNTSITVTSGATSTLNFALTPGIVLANGTIEGTVTNNSSGLAISLATVSAGVQSNVTDVNGNYSISIGFGTYTLTASAPGYQSNSTSITVTSGATSTLNFALIPRTGTQTYNISGFKINNSDNKGIAGWNISLSGAVMANTTTDANGFYQFTNLSSGSYIVTEETRADFTPVGANTIQVTITDHDISDVTFRNKPRGFAVPEFPAVAMPVAAILGLVFLLYRKKNQ